MDIHTAPQRRAKESAVSGQKERGAPPERDGASVRAKCTFELRRERGSPLSAMLLSSFNAFVAYLPYAT